MWLSQSELMVNEMVTLDYEPVSFRNFRQFGRLSNNLFGLAKSYDYLKYKLRLDV